MTAPATWKPADQADPTRICEGPGCRREFRPSKPGQRFCSTRCEAAADVIASARTDDRPRCAYSQCGKPFKPGKGGWSVKFHSLQCAQAAAAEREAGEREAGEPLRVAAPEPAASEPAAAAPPAPPPEPDPAPAPDPLSEIREYGEGHTDGFRSGVREATELTFTLMRSPTFRGLDSVVALMIIREVLDS